MSRIKTDEITLGYDEQGRGQPEIVFLHGVGSDKELWTEQLSHFAQKRRRAVSLDYPGYGESDLVSGKLERQQIAAHMLQALDALGVEAPHIVGLSMGGVIALEICRQQAQRVRSLTIADSFAYHPEGQAILERSLGALLTMSMREFAEIRVPMVLHPATPEALKQKVIDNMSRIDKTSYEWAAEAVWTGDYRAGLSEMRIPTLILVGQQDYLTPLALSEELLAIPGSRLEVVPHAGHLSNIDNPSDFNRLVAEFIDSHSHSPQRPMQ